MFGLHTGTGTLSVFVFLLKQPKIDTNAIATSKNLIAEDFMGFTPGDWVFSCLGIALQSFAFWKIKFKSLKWLMAFLSMADLACILVRNHPLAYWDVYWICSQVSMVWWVWVASSLSFPQMPRFARIPPFAAACVCVAYNPLKSLFVELEYANAHIYGIALVAVVYGFIADWIAEKQLRQAALLILVSLVMGCVSLLAWYLGNATFYSPVWSASLAVLLLCESDNQGLSGKNRPQASTD